MGSWKEFEFGVRLRGNGDPPLIQSRYLFNSYYRKIYTNNSDINIKTGLNELLKPENIIGSIFIIEVDVYRQSCRFLQNNKELQNGDLPIQVGINEILKMEFCVSLYQVGDSVNINSGPTNEILII